MAAEIATPRIECRANGHFVLCPGCKREFAILVTERDDPYAKFVLSRNPDGSESEVRHGSIAEYDLSSFEKHYEDEHA